MRLIAAVLGAAVMVSSRQERVEEIEDFVDFLRQREADRRLIEAAAKLSEDSFRAVWDNPGDAVYDGV